MSNEYTKKLMPSSYDIMRTYDDFEELRELLKSSKSIFHNGGYYSLNNMKWFEEDEKPSFYNFEIEHKYIEDCYLGKKSKEKQIEVFLSLKNKYQKDVLLIQINKYQMCEIHIFTKNNSVNKNWTNKSHNIYGKIKKNQESFNIGHLIADSLIYYSETFDYNKWQNFVMITNWCNRANTINGNQKACGMFYFEKIILDSLKVGREIDYRVTPVFKSDTDSSKKYELLPRGIIIEAKVRQGYKFVGFEGNQFNIFIPNAQSNLIIDYKKGSGIETGVIYKIKEIIYLIKQHLSEKL